MSTATTKSDTPGTFILLSLLAGIHLAALPLYIKMPLIIILLLVCLSLWQFFIITRRKKNPSRTIQLASIAIIFSVIYSVYGHILGQQPGISLIILMTVLKLFETRQQRDAYIIIYSTLFIIASNFFHSQSIWLIVYVFFVIIFLVSILTALSDRLHSTSLRTRLQLSSRYVLYGIPFMLILFLLFPRINGPLWGLPADAFSSKTGLSEEMSPGSINQLISSSAIAFRVKFKDSIPDHADRYWRGAVLSLYDGKTWRRSDAPASTLPNIDFAGSQQSIDYSITLEPTNLHWLLTLEYTDTYPNNYRYNREAMLLSPTKITNVINYSLSAIPSALNRSLFPEEHLKNRLLPVNKNTATTQLAKQLLADANFDANDYLTSVLGYFRNNNFIYTLNPDLLGDDAMDDFLFKTQRGFCEHYASAFVYLMRAAGIPARVVVGYQGGKMNPLGDYMIVRQSDAHAWAEVWIDQRWVRVDPTAAVSPERIENGVSNAGLEPAMLPMLLVTQSELLQNLAFMYDRFQNNWNQWVIGFNKDKQESLLMWLGFDKPSVANLILLLVITLTLISALIFWLMLQNKSKTDDQTQHYYNILCNKLARYGITRQMNEGSSDFQSRIFAEANISIAIKNELDIIFNAYRRLHYGNSSNLQLKTHFIHKIKKLKLR